MNLINPMGLDVTQLLVWGLVAHVLADFVLQNDWMQHKTERGGWRRPAWLPHRRPPDESPTSEFAIRTHALVHPARRRPPWWNRHPAAYVHAGIHLLAFVPLLGLASLPLAVVHLLIDTRTPVAWWSRLIGQTPPANRRAVSPDAAAPDHRPYSMEFDNLTFATRLVDDEGREVDAAGVVVPEVEKLRRELDALKRDMTAWTVPVFDVGMLVRMNLDQAFHVLTIALFAVVVGAL